MARDPFLQLPCQAERKYIILQLRLGVEEGIGIFLLEKLSQVIEPTYLFFIYPIYETQSLATNHLDEWGHMRSFSIYAVHGFPVC